MTKQRQKRAYHKAQLYRLLIRLVDHDKIAANIFFKGGTCSAMLGFLDRFSVDLDFDLKPEAEKKQLRKELYSVFEDLNLRIKDESKNALQFFLRYQSPPGQRNTVKLEILDKTFKANDYQPQYLEPIDRIAVCQTIETMFANKLVALTDRYEKKGQIAGRDVYDIHHYFSQGYDYKKEIIQERTEQTTLDYLKELRNFIENKITRKVINQDLNFLLPDEKFQVIRKTLKQETIMLVGEEIDELS